MDNKFITRISIVFLWVAIILFFSGLCILAFFNHSIADDYYALLWNRKYGFIGYQKYVYLHWGGRYFSNFIASLFSLHRILIPAYYLHTQLLLAFTLVSVYRLITVINRFILTNTINFINRITLSSLLCINLFVVYPELSTALFWFSSAVTYQTSVILLLLLLSTGISWLYSAPNRQPFLFISILLLVIMTNGTNEVGVLFTGIILLILALFNKEKLLKKKFYFLLILVIYLLSFAFTAMAPGNGKRMELIGNKTIHVPIAFISTVFRIFDVYWNIFQSPLFWTSFFALFISAINFQDKLVGIKKRVVDTKIIFRFFLYWTIMLSIVLMPILLISNGSFPERAVNLLTAITVIVLFMLSCYWGIFIENKNILQIAKHANIRYLTIIAIACCIVANRTSKEIASSIISAKLYSNVMLSREIQMDKGQAEHADSLFFPLIENEINAAIVKSNQKAMVKEWMSKKPSLLCFQDDMADSNSRKLFQEYYHIRVISAPK